MSWVGGVYSAPSPLPFILAHSSSFQLGKQPHPFYSQNLLVSPSTNRSEAAPGRCFAGFLRLSRWHVMLTLPATLGVVDTLLSEF